MYDRLQEQLGTNVDIFGVRVEDYTFNKHDAIDDNKLFMIKRGKVFKLIKQDYDWDDQPMTDKKFIEAHCPCLRKKLLVMSATNARLDVEKAVPGKKAINNALEKLMAS